MITLQKRGTFQMTSSRERIIEWLRDAHATEEQAQTMLGRTASQVDGHREFCDGLRRHADISKSQAARLEACLAEMGEDTSKIKDIVGQATAFAQSLSGYLVSDEPVKAVLGTATFARMEVCSYRILTRAAAETNLPKTEAICQTLLEEETQFAQWVEEQADTVTREYLLQQRSRA
jgi:ferritin-like metal-binding protein YciE